jgi:hypothetical protein
MTVFNFCIKVTPMARLSEPNAMRFVAQHTSVPVPKVYCAFVHKGNTSRHDQGQRKDGMLWMAKPHRAVKGKTTQRALLDANRASLRTPPEGAGISNLDGGPFYDYRLPSKLL